jgi:hypothetical protein
MNNRVNGKTGPEFLQSIAETLQQLPNMSYLANVVNEIDRKAVLMTPASEYEDGVAGLAPAPPKFIDTDDKVSFLGSDGDWHSGIQANINREKLNNTDSYNTLYYLLASNRLEDGSMGTAYTDIGLAINQYHYTSQSSFPLDYGILKYLSDPELGDYTSGNLTRLNVGYDRYTGWESREPVKYGELNVGQYLNLNSNKNTSMKPATSIVMGDVPSTSGTYRPFVMKVFGNQFSLYRWNGSGGDMNTFIKTDTSGLEWNIRSGSGILKSLSKLHISNSKIISLWNDSSLDSQGLQNGKNYSVIGENGIHMLSRYYTDSGKTNTTLNAFTFIVNGSDGTSTIRRPSAYSYQSQMWGRLKFGIFNSTTTTYAQEIKPDDYNTDLLSQFLITETSTVLSSILATRGTSVHIAPIHYPYPKDDSGEYMTSTEYTTAEYWGASLFSTDHERLSRNGHRSTADIRFYGPYTPTYTYDSGSYTVTEAMNDKDYEYYKWVRDQKVYVSFAVNNAYLAPDNYQGIDYPGGTESPGAGWNGKYIQRIQLFSIFPDVNDPDNSYDIRTLMYIDTLINSTNNRVTSIGEPEVNIRANTKFAGKNVSSINTLSANLIRSTSAALGVETNKISPYSGSIIVANGVLQIDKRMRSTKTMTGIGIDHLDNNEYYYRPTLVAPTAYITNSDANFISKMNNAPVGTIMFLYTG